GARPRQKCERRRHMDCELGRPQCLTPNPLPTEGSTAMRFIINGRSHDLSIDLRTSLLDLLREHLRLTGTKKGCDQGGCGACTVLVEVVRINSCLALAVQYEGRALMTVEGIAVVPELQP